MKFTKDEIKHIARLARIRLSEAEVEKFASQLTNVLSYVDILNELDTEGVELTSQVTGLTNVMGEDEIGDLFRDPDKLLKCTNLPVKARHILVKNVFEK